MCYNAIKKFVILEFISGISFRWSPCESKEEISQSAIYILLPDFRQDPSLFSKIKSMRSKIKGAFQKASDFLKTKKFLSGKFLFMFFAVAIVVTIGASIPAHSANAGAGFDIWLAGKAGSIYDAIAGISDTARAVAGSDNWLMTLIYSAVVSLLALALKAAALLVTFGAWLIDIMLNPLLYHNQAYTNGVPGAAPGVLDSQTIETGWKTVRDMCNTFFIFFLLLIAFSMILRIQKFGSTKTLLVKFIMSIFLINFSMVIAKIIIDVGQVFMYEILSWMGTFGGKAGSLTSIVNVFDNEVNTGISYSFNDIAKALFAVIYTVVLGLIYIMLAGFLLIRLVMFALLIILSPFAFLSIVLPSMSKYTSEWFDTIVKYSIFGPVFLFFIYLSATMANELMDPAHSASYAGTIPEDMRMLTGILLVMIPHSVALFMLLAVIPVTQRLGGAASQRLIGGTAGIGKIAIGTYGGIKLAGGLGKKVAGGTAGRFKSVQRAQDSLTRGYHKGLAKTGVFRGTAMQKQAAYEKKKEERMKEKEGKYGDLKSINLEILQGKAEGTSGTKEDRALWLKAAAAQGKLGDKKYEDTTKKFMKYGEHAMSKKEVDEITDKNLTLSTQTGESQDRIKNKDYKSFNEEAQGRLKKKETTLEEEIKREKVAGLTKEGKVHQLQGLRNAEDAKAFVKGQTSEELKSNTKRLSKDEQIGFAKGIGENIKKDVKDPKKGVGDMEMMVAKIKIDGDLSGTLDMGNSLDFNSASNVTKQLGTDEIAKLNEESLEYVSETASISQIKNLLKAGKNNIVDEMKKCLGQKAVGANIYKPGSTVNDVKDRIKNIDEQIES